MMTMMPPPHNLHITDEERGVLVRPRSHEKDYKPSALKMTVLDIVNNKSDRFDDKNCSRKEVNFKTKLLGCHLGPGSYDTNFIAKNSGFASLKTKISKAHMPERNTTAAPPPGTYQVPRLMDPPNISTASLLNRQNSASFKSTGRSGLELSVDALSYQTLRNDLFMCNLGPGYYEIPQSFDASTSRPSTSASRPSTSSGRNIEQPLHHCEACDEKTNWHDAFKKSAGFSDRVRPVTSFQIIQFDSGLPLGIARPSTSGGNSGSNLRESTINRVSKHTPAHNNNNNKNNNNNNNNNNNDSNHNDNSKISANNSSKGKRVRMKALPPSVLANMEDIQIVRNLPNYK